MTTKQATHRELKLKCRWIEDSDGVKFAGYNVVAGSTTMDEPDEIYHVIEYSAVTELQSKLDCANEARESLNKYIERVEKERDNSFDKAIALEATIWRQALEIEKLNEYLKAEKAGKDKRFAEVLRQALAIEKLKEFCQRQTELHFSLHHKDKSDAETATAAQINYFNSEIDLILNGTTERGG